MSDESRSIKRRIALTKGEPMPRFLKYKVVGWYSYNPTNEHTRPFARVVYVEAKDKDEASVLGGAALDVEYEKQGVSVDLLNWYVEEVK